MSEPKHKRAVTGSVVMAETSNFYLKTMAVIQL